jgi:hypothetical protein
MGNSTRPDSKRCASNGAKGGRLAEEEGGQWGCHFCGDKETRDAMVQPDKGKSDRCSMIVREPGLKLWRGVEGVTVPTKSWRGVSIQTSKPCTYYSTVGCIVQYYPNARHMCNEMTADRCTGSPDDDQTLNLRIFSTFAPFFPSVERSIEC